VDFVNQATHDKLADERAGYAFRALIAAATVCGARAVVLPFLIAFAPPNTFPGADADILRNLGLGQAAFFALLALWARRDPLPPAIAALACYGGLAVPDILNHTGILAQGLIGKFIMLIILARALVAGILHRAA
jgi:hypothetical protein